MNFTNVLCLVQKWQCGVQFLLMALWPLLLWESEGAYSHCECRAVQSYVGNISAHWVTSSLARFDEVPTRWRNCSHNRNFHANPQDNATGQTHFSFRANHLARPLVWPCGTRLLSLGLLYKQGIRNTSCQYCWLTTANSGVYSMDSQENATTCYDSFSIATTGMYWTTLWSYTGCHIQPIMTEMNRNGYGMQPIVLITYFTSP